MNGKGDQLSGRLLDFVVKVIKIVDALPKTVGGRHIGGQLISAGTSCGPNYEEACGAESRSDFVHKMSIVLKELKETRYWLRVICRTEMLTPNIDGLVKSRHSRVGGNPDPTKPIEKTGFPFPRE
jgi:four helix bundle protein